MPLYEYRDTKTGRVVEEYHSASLSVPIGERTTIDGRELVRLPPSSFQSMVEPSWEHTVYAAGPEETKAWKAAGGAIDPAHDLPRLTSSRDIMKFEGLREKATKGRYGAAGYDYGQHGRNKRRVRRKSG